VSPTLSTQKLLLARTKALVRYSSSQLILSALAAHQIKWHGQQRPIMEKTHQKSPHHPSIYLDRFSQMFPLILQ
jgi:hypothetical protein